MPTPNFILHLRQSVGHANLWLHGVTAVIFDEDQVLLARRADSQEYTPITGILEPGEEPAVGLLREVLEETGIIVTVQRLAWVHVVGPVTYPNNDIATYLDLTFRCRYVSGRARIADDENTDVQWFPIQKLPASLDDDCRRRLQYAQPLISETRYETSNSSARH